jgi:hypothetical protein
MGSEGKGERGEREGGGRERERKVKGAAGGENSFFYKLKIPAGSKRTVPSVGMLGTVP